MVYTVYPRGWFEGRSVSRAKKHAYAADVAPVRGAHRVSFCGVYGSAVDIEFTATEGNAITCGRCVKAAAKVREREGG